LKKKPNNKNRFWIAVLIISVSFGLIASMLAIHSYTTANLLEDVDVNNETATKNLNSTIEKVNAQNQMVFNILLPVFAAWVATVVAFYFGSENTEKLQNANTTLTNLLSGKVDNVTLKELLDKYPESKEIQFVKYSDTVEASYNKSKKFGNAVVLDHSETLMGIVYEDKLKDLAQDSKDKVKTFEQIRDKLKDPYTDKPWSDAPFQNYAMLIYADKLSHARNKLESIKIPNYDAIGLVIEQDKAVAAIDLGTLTKWFN